jgi:hypothetical protein
MRTPRILIACLLAICSVTSGIPSRQEVFGLGSVDPSLRIRESARSSSEPRNVGDENVGTGDRQYPSLQTIEQDSSSRLGESM